jgi:ribosomal protein L21
MYTVVETAGFQFKVTLGEVIRVPSAAEAEVGSTLEIKSVLAHHNGTEFQVGTPVLANAIVKAEVLAHGRDKKVKIFKHKRRQGYRLTKGHRQGFTEVVITEVSVNGQTQTVDAQKLVRERARVAALAKQKEQQPRLTRKEKVARDLAAKA